MITSDEFIQRAKDVHGNLYNYDKSCYVGSREKIEINCPIHGTFYQSPDKHINKAQGCPVCAKESRIFTLEEFISRAICVHGIKYDYTKTIYERSYKKININCQIHGVFYQKPNSHLNGEGCPECSYDVKRTPVDELIDKFNHIHHNRYDYSEVNYINNYTPINIICDKHGIFSQSPSWHIRGTNCPKCTITTKFSKKAIKWLEYIAKKENINIVHAGNAGEYLIRDTKYKADGYCVENNTVYEFYGDVFHGNLNIFEKDNCCHPFDKTKTALELFNTTMKREDAIIDKGYNLISIWESEYDKIYS